MSDISVNPLPEKLTLGKKSNIFMDSTNASTEIAANDTNLSASKSLYKDYTQFQNPVQLKKFNEINLNNTSFYLTPSTSERDKLGEMNEGEKVIIEKYLINSRSFRFPTKKAVIYLDQKGKTNLFMSLFPEIFNRHKYVEMVNKDKKKFKIVNRETLKKILKDNQENNKNPFINIIFKKNTLKGVNAIRRQSTFIIMTHNLTKIPTIRVDHQTRRLNYEYKKAKDAAVHVRRLEYAYNMELVAHKIKFEAVGKAKIIQKWWRALQINHIYYYVASKIQAHFRGYLVRKAKRDCNRVVKGVIPFLFKVDNSMCKTKLAGTFKNLYENYGYAAGYRHINENLRKIKRKFWNHYTNQRAKSSGGNAIQCYNVKTKCKFTKHIFDKNTQNKLKKIFSVVKGFLIRNNPKIQRKFAFKNNPYLFYHMRYGKNKELLKKKFQKFHRVFNKFQVLNLKVNKKYKDQYDFLRQILKKIVTKELQEATHQRNENRKFLEKVIQTQNLKKYLNLWKLKVDKMNSLDNVYFFARKSTNLKRLTRLTKEKNQISFIKALLNLSNKKTFFKKKGALLKMMKYSKKYMLKELLKNKEKQLMKKKFKEFKIKCFSHSLVEHFNLFIKRRNFMNWANKMYKTSKTFTIVKTSRNVQKLARKKNIRKFFNKWRRAVDDVSYNLEKFEKNHSLEIKLNFWRSKVSKIIHREKTLSTTLKKVDSANEGFFRRNAKGYFFERWKLMTEIHNNFVKPMSDIKIRFFYKLLHCNFNKQVLRNKNYFLGKMKQKKSTKETLLQHLVKKKHSQTLGNSFLGWHKKVIQKKLLSNLVKSYQKNNTSLYFFHWKKISMIEKLIDKKHFFRKFYLLKHFNLWRAKSKEIQLLRAGKKIDKFIRKRTKKNKLKKIFDKLFINALQKAAKEFTRKLTGENIRNRIGKSKASLKAKRAKALKKAIEKSNPIKGYFDKWKIDRSPKKKQEKIRTKLEKLVNSKSIKKKKILKVFYFRYKKQIGMDYIKTYHNNSQINFYYKPRRFIVGKKYRMLKYVISRINQANKRFILQVYFYQLEEYNISAKRNSKLENLLLKKQKCLSLTKAKVYFTWRKISLRYKILSKVIYIQKRFKSHLLSKK